MRRVLSRAQSRSRWAREAENQLSASFSTDESSKGEDRKTSEKKETAPSSAPISQLFSRLNLNVKSDRTQQRSRAVQQPARPQQIARPQQPGPRQSQKFQETGVWSRPQRSQDRQPRESFDARADDDFGFGAPQQSRPRQRQRSSAGQGRPQRGRTPARGERDRAEDARMKGGQTTPRRRQGLNIPQGSTSARNREAQLLRNAPKEIQELAAEEEIFRLGEGEPMALIDKKTQNRIRSTAEMPQRPDQIRADIERAQVMAMDPTVNMNWGAPLRLPEYTLEDMFEKEAEALKASFGIESEEEWQETKHIHLARTKEVVEAQNKLLHIRNEQADEAELCGMRDSVPEDHPMRSHVNMVVHQLTRNPGWSFQQKHQYMSKLLRTYVHKRLH